MSALHISMSSWYQIDVDTPTVYANDRATIRHFTSYYISGGLHTADLINSYRRWRIMLLVPPPQEGHIQYAHTQVTPCLWKYCPCWSTFGSGGGEEGGSGGWIAGGGGNGGSPVKYRAPRRGGRGGGAPINAVVSLLVVRGRSTCVCKYHSCLLCLTKQRMKAGTDEKCWGRYSYKQKNCVFATPSTAGPSIDNAVRATDMLHHTRNAARSTNITTSNLQPFLLAS